MANTQTLSEYTRLVDEASRLLEAALATIKPNTNQAEWLASAEAQAALRAREIANQFYEQHISSGNT
jgi:hypothetical protein